MKLMLEGWNKFLKESEELDEGFMSAITDPEIRANVGTVITAFVEMAKIFGPVAAAGMIVGYASNKTGGGASGGPKDFKFDLDTDPDKTKVSTDPGDTEAVLKGMEWPKKREPKK